MVQSEYVLFRRIFFGSEKIRKTSSTIEKKLYKEVLENKEFLAEVNSWILKT
jgi:hypothetical protein